MTSYWNIFWIVVFGILILTGCSDEPASVDGSVNQLSSANEESDDEDDESGVIRLSDIAAEAAGIKVEMAETARMGDRLNLPAEVRFDADRVAKISPQIGGVRRQVF